MSRYDILLSQRQAFAGMKCVRRDFVEPAFGILRLTGANGTESLHVTVGPTSGRSFSGICEVRVPCASRHTSWRASVLVCHMHHQPNRRRFDGGPGPYVIIPVANTDPALVAARKQVLIHSALPSSCELLMWRARPVLGLEQPRVTVLANLADIGSVVSSFVFANGLRLNPTKTSNHVSIAFEGNRAATRDRRRHLLRWPTTKGFDVVTVGKRGR